MRGPKLLGPTPNRDDRDENGGFLSEDLDDVEWKEVLTKIRVFR